MQCPGPKWHAAHYIGASLWCKFRLLSGLQKRVDHDVSAGLVDHQNIIPAEYLPTFSSTAIIVCLHHIHGLRERYLYLNDDVFFLRPVQKEDFYDGECSLFYVNDKSLDDSNRVSEESHSDQNGVVFSRTFMQREFGVTDPFPMPEHAPKPIQRSWMMQLEKQFPFLFQDAMQGRFRRADAPIIDDLFFRWPHYLGRAQYRQNRNCYMENCAPDAAEQYAALLEGRHDALCLCINGYAGGAVCALPAADAAVSGVTFSGKVGF